MTDLNGELDRLALSMRLQVRMGAASGYCTVGDFGEGDRLDYTVIGPAVNLASRLEPLAPVDGLLIDEATHKLASAKVQRSHWGEHQDQGRTRTRFPCARSLSHEASIRHSLYSGHDIFLSFHCRLQRRSYDAYPDLVESAGGALYA